MDWPAGHVPETRDCVTAGFTLSVTLPVVPPPLKPVPAVTAVMSPPALAVVGVVPPENRMPPALRPIAGPPLAFSKKPPKPPVEVARPHTPTPVPAVGVEVPYTPMPAGEDASPETPRVE